MAYTDVEYIRERMKDALLMGPTPKIGYRGPGRTPSIKGADFGPAGKYLKKYFDEQRRNKPEGSPDWTSYTDFQDYESPPTDYSYLSRNYGG